MGALVTRLLHFIHSCNSPISLQGFVSNLSIHRFMRTLYHFIPARIV